MDLAQFEPVTESVPVPLRHPVTDVPLVNEDGKPVTVDLVGIDSQAFRTRQRAMVNKRLAGGKKARLTAEMVETESIETIAACIKGWSNIELDGKALSYSHDNAILLLTRLPVFREQIDEAIADRANFLKRSPTN